MKRFDAIVIGAGQAGPPLARRLAAAGQTVAIVERDLFGGTCVNTGCIPTKTLVACARAAHVVRRAAEYGVRFGPDQSDIRIGFDLPRAKARALAVSTDARRGVESALERTERCTVVRGHARFESADTVRVGDVLLGAPRVFIDVGGRARIPPIAGLAEAGNGAYLTNASILALETVPRHLVVVGGGPVGLEFAQMYRRFGSEVTVVELGPRLLGREDDDVCRAVSEILESEGVQAKTGAECLAVRREGQDLTLKLRCASGDESVTGSHVLLATGRQPNTDDLGLERAGVKVDRRGYVVVDDHLRTSAPGVWALGECNGQGAFTHTAYNDFEIVAANLLDDEPRKLSDRIEAYALYVDPPLGRVGLGLEAARKTGRPYLVGERPMTRVGRAVEKGETQGFMRVLVEAETKKIAGATILGTGGDEAVHAILYAMYAGATASTLARSMGIHPTLSELLPTLMEELRPLA